MSVVGRTLLLGGVFVALMVSAFVYWTIQTPQLSAEQMRERGVVLLPSPRDITAFTMADHTGATFDNSRLLNKWTFLFFGFTNCPDVCPTSMSVLGQVDGLLRTAQSEFVDLFQGVLVTVDPERDTADRLGQYATAFSPRFLGVSGDRASTFLLAKQLHVAFAKVPTADGYTVDHTGNIVIVNPDGHYHGYIKLPHKAQTIRLAFQSLAAQF